MRTIKKAALLRQPRFFKSAQEWIRTITTLRMLRPEHSASTNFATWAGEHKLRFQDRKYRKRTLSQTILFTNCFLKFPEGNYGYFLNVYIAGIA